VYPKKKMDEKFLKTTNLEKPSFVIMTHLKIKAT
jgi:hypothetical protein